MKPYLCRKSALACLLALSVVLSAPDVVATTQSAEGNEVLDWNQVFIDTLIATSTPNSSSQRLGAIVHTAIFDALNGIERRYAPLFVQATAPRGASRRAAVIAAAHTALVGLFPLRKSELDASYTASLETLTDDGEEVGEDGGQSRARGISWGEDVAAAVLEWRLSDGFNVSYPAFVGGTAIGQWRPIPPATSMSAQALAFTSMFALVNNTQFRPPAPRTLASATYVEDFAVVKALGRNTRTPRGPRTKRSWLRSGRGMSAFIGTRRQIKLRAPTVCRSPIATVCSPCSTSGWPIPHSQSGAQSATTGRFQPR
jgi:hypothetical protein